MKLLGSLSGTAAVNISGEQTVPETGFLQRDLVAYVTNLYSFDVSPAALNNPGMHLPVLQFHSGACKLENQIIPILQIIATFDGDAVSAQNTNLADAVLSDYLSHLEDDLNFRFSKWNPIRIYQSVLLVEFERKFIENIVFSPFQRVVNEIVKPGTEIYSLKRVTFGQDASNYAPPQPSIHQFLSKDFVIERRANEPMESNRFFCTAPLTTDRHIEALERIEAASL